MSTTNELATKLEYYVECFFFKLLNNCILVVIISGVDSKIRFSIEPLSGDCDAFEQWRDAMRAVSKLPMGIPCEFRKKVRTTFPVFHIAVFPLWNTNTTVHFYQTPQSVAR